MNDSEKGSIKNKKKAKKAATILLCGFAGSLFAGIGGFATIASLTYLFYDEIESSSK